MSARTLEGLEDVKDQLLEAAFDKALFPHFGEVQPGTYGLIVRHLGRTHADHPSMTWSELEHAASTEPVIDVAAVDIRVSFRTSSLIHTDDGKAFRAFSYTLSIHDEQLVDFTVRFSKSQAMHQDLEKRFPSIRKRINFPAKKTDNLRDMTHDEANVDRRAQELLEYYRQLFASSAIVATDGFIEWTSGSALAGCDAASLVAKYLEHYGIWSENGLSFVLLNFLRFSL